jgi:hypothetical protein
VSFQEALDDVHGSLVLDDKVQRKQPVSVPFLKGSWAAFRQKSDHFEPLMGSCPVAHGNVQRKQTQSCRYLQSPEACLNEEPDHIQRRHHCGTVQQNQPTWVRFSKRVGEPSHQELPHVHGLL